MLLDPSHRVVSSGDLSDPLRRERLGSSCCSSAVGGAVTGAVTNVAQPRVLVPKRRQPPRAVTVTLPPDPGVGCRPACVEQGRVGLRLQLLALRVPGLLLGRVLALHLFRPLVGRKCVLLRTTPAGVRRQRRRCERCDYLAEGIGKLSKRRVLERTTTRGMQARRSRDDGND